MIELKLMRANECIGTDVHRVDIRADDKGRTSIVWFLFCYYRHSLPYLS